MTERLRESEKHTRECLVRLDLYNTQLEALKRLKTSSAPGYGFEKGEVCGRNGCPGIIKERERRGCSCHINPPCSSCVEEVAYCEKCDWGSKDEK